MIGPKSNGGVVLLGMDCLEIIEALFDLAVDLFNVESVGEDRIECDGCKEPSHYFSSYIKIGLRDLNQAAVRDLERVDSIYNN